MKIELKNEKNSLLIKRDNVTVLSIKPRKTNTFTVFVGGDKNKMAVLNAGQSFSASFTEGKPRIEVNSTNIVVQYRDKILYTISVNKNWVSDKIGVIF